MRILIFFFLVYMSLTASCTHSDLNCEKYRNGKFLRKPQNSNRQLLIQRNDSVQVETDITENRITKWKVNWIGCKYSLTLQNANFELHTNMKPKDYFFEYEIIKQTKTYYVYKVVSSVFENDVLSDTIWIIH
jgi:hypothetical protein